MKSFLLLREILFFRIGFKLLMIGLSLISACLGILGPFLQKEFLDFLSEGDPLSRGMDKGSPIQWIHQNVPFISFLNLQQGSPLFYLMGSFLCLLGVFSLMQIVYLIGAWDSVLMQRKLSQRIYDKILELRSDSLSGRTVGELVAIYATDVSGAVILLEQSIPQAAGILFPLILSPIAIRFVLKIPTHLIFIAMVSMILLSFTLAYRQSIFFFRFKKLAADRLALVSEWAQNLRILRILGWIKPYENKIFNVRKLETKNRIAMLYNGQTMNAVSSSITFTLNILALFSWIIISKERVSPGQLMALVWILGIFLTRPFRQLPWLFTFSFDAWTSIKRISQFLSSTNRVIPNFEDDSQGRVRVNFTVPDKEKTNNFPESALSVQDLTLDLTGKEILNRISFSVGVGEFIAVVGEVGSGKTSLLLALMKEISAQYREHKLYGEDFLERVPQFIYVPQESFILNGTLRENLVFSYNPSTEQDQQIMMALNLAQWGLDFNQLEQGLNQEIGERGVNLSGGQKQRLSLARAHVTYMQTTQPQIFLLDDALSAVDVNTEQLLIEKLFRGAWKDQTLILVTHRLSVLEKADRILFLMKGKLLEQGTYLELTQRSDDFRKFTASLLRQVESEILS